MKYACKPDEFGCVGHTVKTSTGPYLDFDNPEPSMFRIEDIATGLCNACRFGNQLPFPKFYTVAEHSVHCARAAVQDGCTAEQVLAVLMHDGSEAYTGDISKPLKQKLGDAFKVIESNLMDAIGIRFNIDFDKHHDVIKRYDRAMLVKERELLYDITDSDPDWSGFGSEEQVQYELNSKSFMMNRWTAREAFMVMFNSATDYIARSSRSNHV